MSVRCSVAARRLGSVLRRGAASLGGPAAPPRLGPATSVTTQPAVHNGAGLTARGGARRHKTAGHTRTASRLPPGVRARQNVATSGHWSGSGSAEYCILGTVRAKWSARVADPLLAWRPKSVARSSRRGCRVSSLHARARVRHEAPSCRRGRDAAHNRSPWMRRPPRQTAAAPFTPRIRWAGGTAAVTPSVGGDDTGSEPSRPQTRSSTIHLFTIGYRRSGGTCEERFASLPGARAGPWARRASRVSSYTGSATEVDASP
jgi:hypothetical protein